MTVTTKGKYSAGADGHVKAFAIFDHINIADGFVSYNVVLALFWSFVHRRFLSVTYIYGRSVLTYLITYNVYYVKLYKLSRGYQALRSQTPVRSSRQQMSFKAVHHSPCPTHG